jgi:hypothetical protein
MDIFDPRSYDLFRVRDRVTHRQERTDVSHLGGLRGVGLEDKSPLNPAITGNKASVRWRLRGLGYEEMTG